MELSATENMRERHRIELRASRSVDAAKKVIRDGFFARIKLSKKFKKGINIMD